jgi:TolB-like protein/class 3 adenylate cyclase/Flp pilus assembly protein TadD
MSETRKIAAILVSDVVGYSRLAGADEDRTLARLRALRSDLIDPTISVHHGRIVKRTGDGSVIEFRSVVDAVRCALEVQHAMVERNAGVALEKRIEFRIGIHLGDVVEETDGDLMGDGVNIAARLEGIAGPGAICLSEDAYRQVKGRLDLVVTDLGPTQLKNIAEPIRAYSLEVGKAEQPKPAPIPGPEKSVPPRLSIVVLPFANIGGDPEQEYFVDGVTESLTTDLSRIRGSFVIGRNTAFTFKGKAVDLKQIGRELNVRYILEGSAQRGGNRIRVNVQLVEAQSGAHIWAERFDSPLSDLLDMQDELVSRLARQLDAELIAAEARRAELSPHPDSTDLYFRGKASLNKGLTAQNFGQAREFFERALVLDSGNIDAQVGMAAVEVMAANTYQIKDQRSGLAAAEETLTDVLLRAPNYASAHFLMGMILTFTGRPSQGIAECERALALDRNLAAARAFIGVTKHRLGRVEETEADVREALRISPRDQDAFAWFAYLATAKLYLGKHDEAVEEYRRSQEYNRNHPLVSMYLGAALALGGRVEEARAEVREGLKRLPEFTIRTFREGTLSDNPIYLAQRERLYEGMRKAGVPEE